MMEINSFLYDRMLDNLKITALRGFYKSNDGQNYSNIFKRGESVN